MERGGERAFVQHGGVSILITSATDALAFLVGSSTVLPALSWFCAFCGIGIIMCFLLQMFLFLPALQVNAMRAEANYLDCWCCCKSKFKHEFNEPRGCCGCCRPQWCPPNILSHMMTSVARGLTTVAGATLSFLAFAGLLAAGIYGTTQLYDSTLFGFRVNDCVVRMRTTYLLSVSQTYRRHPRRCCFCLCLWRTNAGTKISRLSGLFRQTRICATFTSKTTSTSKQESPLPCTRRALLTTLSHSNRSSTCTIVSPMSTLSGGQAFFRSLFEKSSCHVRPVV